LVAFNHWSYRRNPHFRCHIFWMVYTLHM
jgi:hypothetical protein